MIKPSLMIELTLVGTLYLYFPPLAAAQNAEAAQVESPRPAASLQIEASDARSSSGVVESGKDQRVRFSFEQADWQDVIPWFADQAGFSLQPIDDWPDGTFHLVDASAYSVIDALDQLNHALRLRTPAYTLIRNRDMLVLKRVDDGNFPSELIETVPVEQLDKRGKYETLRCVFEFGELDCTDFDEQLQQLVSGNNASSFAVFPGANQIHIRETGATLRVIRDVIRQAQQQQNARDSSMVVHRLQHLDADSFLFVARDLLGMKADANQRENGSLSISAEPLGDRLFVKGTASALAQFDEVAALLDVAPAPLESTGAIDKPFFRSYRVTSDPKLALDTLQTFLAGRESVRIQQDAITGAIAVMGRKADHQIVLETLEMIESSNGQQFAIIQLQYADPTSVIITLRNLWGQVGELDPQGPVLLGNSLERTVIVRGTPTEVAQVKSMIAQLDEAATNTPTGPRSRTRVIPMDDAKRDEVLGVLEDYWPSTGRSNDLRINLILPEDRPAARDRFRRTPPPRDPLPLALPPNPSNERSRSEFNNTHFKPKSPASLLRAARAMVAWAVVGMPRATQSVLVYEPQQSFGPSQPSSSSTTSETSKSTTRPTNPDYQPPPKVESVPGADIQVKATAGGIVITSKDLDALDDMEDLIREQVGEASSVQAPTFFFLKHRYAQEVTSFLQGYFGLADSGGGGEGGMGGMVGGMLNNVMGGGTSDLLGGLMGGGGLGLGGDDAILEGEVRFGTDSTFNAIYVTGATSVDLDQINEVIEILDQPNAPQDPELLGEFRTIPILHRDPEEVKAIIEQQLSDLIQTGAPGEGGGQGGDQNAEQMMKLVQQIAGGGEGGKGGSASVSERPKARLGVDLKTGQLLVTGPDFIYKEVLKMVMELDKPQLSTPPTYVVIPNGGKNSELLKRNLKAIFGSKVEINDDSDSNGSDGDRSGGGDGDSQNKSQQNAVQAQANQANEMRRQMFREMRRAQQRQNGQGGGGGRGSRGG